MARIVARSMARRMTRTTNTESQKSNVIAGFRYLGKLEQSDGTTP
jgi:hypothetical protein